jgi:hypothetical protein
MTIRSVVPGVPPHRNPPGAGLTAGPADTISRMTAGSAARRTQNGYPAAA